MLEAELNDGFERTDVVYQTLDGIPFEVSILAPRSIILTSSSPRPLLVHFHGGGLILGTAFDPEITPKWLFQYAESKGAIVVSPCYRLIPEATGSQILEDVGSFWCWVRNSLGGAVSKRWHLLSVDFDRVAAAGPGSGGILALQSALLWPETRINIIMGQYCGIYPDNTAFNPKPPQPLDKYEEFVSGCLARVKPGTFRVSSPWPEYFDLAKAAIETGRWRDLLREDKALELRDRLRESKELPPVWIVQGAQDRLVCQAATAELVQDIRSAHPRLPVLYTVVPGGHGFDMKTDLGEGWVQDGISFANQFWGRGATSNSQCGNP